jgi:hypothetical protein
MINGLKDFYPTPAHLIEKMLEKVKTAGVQHILEPSAGKGDICEGIKKSDAFEYRRALHIDVIEIDSNLQHILRGKEYNLVYDDFLSFETAKSYDLIIANFPFGEGDKHLAHALGLLAKTGGQLVCLVNAETLRNPHTNLRKAIVHQLGEHGACVEYLKAQFTEAERKTDVEVALIALTLEAPAAPSVILDSLQRAATVPDAESPEEQLIDRNFTKAFIARFDLEAELGLRLIDEWQALQPYITDKLAKDEEGRRYAKPLIKLEIEGHPYEGKNGYLCGLRLKYWEVLLRDERFTCHYTSNILRDLETKLKDLQHCDFNLFNIKQLETELSANVATGVNDAILKLFDELSQKFAYDESIHNGNCWYFNGWKTNKAHKINSKIILPMNGFSSYSWEKDTLDRSYIQERLTDVVKVFNWLAAREGTLDVPRLVGDTIETTNRERYFRNMDLRYLSTTFFKKGTCHITFKDQRLLDKLNIYGSQRKGWLPPAYGKKHYAEMDPEERAVVDSFQGEEAYRKVMERPDFYLVEVTGLPLLTNGGNHEQT